MRFQRFPLPFALVLVSSASLSSPACRDPERLPVPRRADAGARSVVGDAPAGIAAAGPLPPATIAQRGTYLSLLYAAGLQGEYEHCGCPSHPSGGLVRRATVIDQARAEADGVLVVDAGDLLLPARFHDDKLAPPAPSEVERRARLILSAYARMGIQAVLPAERDLALGPDKLKRLMQALGVPAVASNLVDRAGRPFFARDRLVTVAGVPVGIFGVVAPQPEDAGAWKNWPVHATLPEEAGRAEVASLRARGAKMIVALLHLGPAGAAQKYLEAVPGIAWAVDGHAGSQLQTPETVGGARLLDAMAMGRLAGRLDIHIVGGSMAWKDRGARAQLLEIIADHRGQLADLAKRAAEDKTHQLQSFYQQRQEAIGKALANELAQARTLPAVMHGSWYENRIIPLDETIPDQRGITLLVAAYDAENARRAAAGKPVGIALHDPRAPAPPNTGAAAPAAPLAYAGSAACAGCHQAAWQFFTTTKHAHALAALSASQTGARRDRDPTCIGCHVTGYLLPGGTWDLDVATSRLKDVGCESCHGPSLGHVTSGDQGGEKKRTTRREVPETVCRGCHTPDQIGGEFDAATFRKAVLGPGHGA